MSRRRAAARGWALLSILGTILAFTGLFAGGVFHDMGGHEIHVLVSWGLCALGFFISAGSIALATDHLT